MNSLAILIEQMSLKDALDIAIVALLIYQGLLIIRGTRAVHMLLGLLALLGLFWVGRYFQLYSLNWILDHFFDYFFIFAIILFQDQFRSALASFGAGRRWRLFNRKNGIDLDIPEIVEACEILSENKIGALIVIERGEGLLNYIGTGTTLDCRVHSDLIFSIFQAASPLHDGAIILSQGRLRAAGCFLPLSKNHDIHRHMGTRHRAALGISENSDAVAVTVSEETGKMHIAIAGKFFVCSNGQNLGHYLEHLCGGQHGGSLGMTLEEGERS